jgi:tetratricopeptide (TPR) repeat protein
VLYQRAKDLPQARHYYEEAARLDPNDGLTQLNLGRVYWSLNQPEAAEQAFENVMRLAPDEPEGPGALAQLYIRSHRNPAQARRLAQRAVQLAPKGQYYALLAQACAVGGDQSAALAALNQALALEPENPQLIELQGLILKKK